jgi:hypothetical protein
LTASGFTSGTTSGTSGSIRKWLELSMTIGPAAPIFAPFLGDAPPALISTMSTVEKSNCASVLACRILVAERDFHADGFAAGDGVHLVHGEFHFLEDVEHLAAHIARGADHGAVTHRALLYCSAYRGSYASCSPRARRGKLARRSA